jgi:hypothetical protein
MTTTKILTAALILFSAAVTFAAPCNQNGATAGLLAHTTAPSSIAVPSTPSAPSTTSTTNAVR